MVDLQPARRDGLLQLGDPAPGIVAHAAPQVIVGQQVDDARRQLSFVARWDEDARGAVLDVLGQAAYLGGDDRLAKAVGVEQDAAGPGRDVGQATTLARW